MILLKSLGKYVVTEQKRERDMKSAIIFLKLHKTKWPMIVCFMLFEHCDVITQCCGWITSGLRYE